MNEHQVHVVDIDRTTPLNSLGEAAHTNTVEKGFYTPFPAGSLELATRIMQSIALQTDVLDAHRKDRDITAFHTLEHLPNYHELTTDERESMMRLLLIISEVVECADAVMEASEEHEAEELADIFIRLVDFAAARDIDLDAAVAAKMEVNTGRPYKHGKKF